MSRKIPETQELLPTSASMALTPGARCSANDLGPNSLTVLHVEPQDCALPRPSIIYRPLFVGLGVPGGHSNSRCRCCHCCDGGSGGDGTVIASVDSSLGAGAYGGRLVSHGVHFVYCTILLASVACCIVDYIADCVECFDVLLV